MANFNRIAGLYDFLKRMVFDEQLEKASSYFLSEVPSNKKILIIGGGTGQILKSIHFSSQIKYVEHSAVMIRKAKKSNFNGNIEFIQEDILRWQSEIKFDCIITPFVLDCFSESQLDFLIPKLKSMLVKEGCWIQTDFYPKNFKHQLLIKSMYYFFRLSANLKINQIPDFDSMFDKYKFICKRKALFSHSMVESKIYKQIE